MKMACEPGAGEVFSEQAKRQGPISTNKKSKNYIKISP